ncbi:MAG: hypothetical protein A2W25_13580 [candidate division Zixibacteria bacterium RBG_16_53_22]|nr:MAG: hypothetical protein A2W25_13580 [candidate division Zixibacteria bacterium RBG_16_53_22]
MRSVETIVFDKTGTLTQGVFKVTDIAPINGFTKKQILSWAARAEANSNHPIAISIREASGKNEPETQNHDFEEIGGQGIKAIIDGKTVLVGNDHLLHEYSISHDTCAIAGTAVHVAVDNTYAGYIIISDELKPDTESAIRELRRSGTKTIVMLTGDSGSAAQPIAEELGLDGYYAGIMPEEKVVALERLLSEQKHGKVAFVGDGINDAPVLARADVGISMGNLVSCV